MLCAASLSFLSYCSMRDTNPVTGEKQYVALSPKQEIALGLQALPELEKQYGGIEGDTRSEAIVDAVGAKLVNSTAAKTTPYKFDFHVLNDNKTLNAFALPGGQVFITSALLGKLTTEGQLAGVLGHEIGHVIARHGSEHMAKQKLTSGLTGAAVLATYDPTNPSSRASGAIAQIVGQLVNMKFGRSDELESDKLGVKFMAESGYNPNSMIGVMEILGKEAKRGNTPEFFSTHPNPDNRITKIKDDIKALYPNGVPQGLKP
ncbi:M48 family peptidase [bacterium]|nr:MAG: M48 family peptidase [bacterium]